MYVGKYGLIEGDEVKGMVRMTMNTVFYTRNRIGLARFLDGKQQSLETSICSTVKKLLNVNNIGHGKLNIESSCR